jgi:hypothetical protein
MQDWEIELTQNLEMFTSDKKHWTPEELQMVYRIWNGALGEKFGYKNDTGCGSCRRDVVTGVRKFALQYVK